MYDLDIFTDGSCRFVSPEKKDNFEFNYKCKVRHPLTYGWGGLIVPRRGKCTAYWGNQKASIYDSGEAELLAIYRTLVKGVRDEQIKAGYTIRLFSDSDRVYLLFAHFLLESGILLDSHEISKQSHRGLNSKVRLEEVNLLFGIGYLCYNNRLKLIVQYPYGVYQKQAHTVCHSFAKCCSRIKVFNHSIKWHSKAFEFVELQNPFFADYHVFHRNGP